MLGFILYTILSIIAGNAMLKFFFEMTQAGGGLDIMFGWQKMLANFYAKGAQENKKAKYYVWLESALGGCQKCTSFWFMPMWFVCYYIVSKFVFHIWITDELHNWFLIVFTNWFWFSMFCSVGVVSGFYALTRFKKKANVV